MVVVPMRECSGKHSCMSSTFPIAMQNGTFFFARRISPLAETSHIKSTREGGWFVICRSFKSVFLLIEFHCCFKYLKKQYHIMFINIIFWLGCGRPSGLLSFVPVLLLFILTPLFLPSSSVSLSYFILAVPCASVWENTRAWIPHLEICMKWGIFPQ